MTKAVVKKVNVLGAPKAWWAPVFQGACTLAGYPALSFFFKSLRSCIRDERAPQNAAAAVASHPHARDIALKDASYESARLGLPKAGLPEGAGCGAQF